MKTKLLKMMCTLFAVMVCASVNAAVYSGNCGNSPDGQSPTDAVTWKVDGTTLTISGTGAVKTFSNQSPMAYPWNDQTTDAATFNPVDEEGFWTGITTLKIEEGVTNIPDYAFAMQKRLNYVYLPSTLKSIGNSALEECAFTKLDLSASLETIGDYAFLGAKFKSITLPKTLTSIGESAFNSCKNLTAIVVPENVTSIGGWAFYDCTALKMATLTCAAPPTLGENVFMANVDETQTIIPALQEITVMEGALDAFKTAQNWSTYASLMEAAFIAKFVYTSAKKLDNFDNLSNFIGARYQLSHIFEIETGIVTYVGKVTGIGDNAFVFCSDLRSIVIPEGVEEIGFQSFKGCSNLVNIDLPLSLKLIGDTSGLAFDGCSKLAEGHFVIKDLKWWCSMVIKGWYSNPIYYAKHIYDTNNQEITDLVIPEDVTSIGDYAFCRCEGLKSVTFHDKMTYLGSNSFYSCTGLTNVEIPASIKTINEGAFMRCSNLASVTIPEGIETIGFEAFVYSGLTSLTLPSTISKMSQSFVGCEKLATLTLTDGISNIGGSFYSCPSLTQVRIPGSVKTMTYQDFMRNEGLQTVVIDEGVEEVAGFDDCPKLANLTIPSSAKKLGTFNNCTSLTNVFLPEGVEYIASFNGCSNLQQINIPSTVTYVGTFKYCTALEKVIVADLKSWCHARHYDANLYSPMKPSGRLYVGTPEQHWEVTDLVIPEGTEKIDSWAFCHLTYLTSVSIPSTVKLLGGGTFRGCTNIEEIVLPEGLEQFGYMEFAGCTKLAKLTIPSTVTKIDQEAFVEVANLADVWCKAYPNKLYWRDYNFNTFMPEKATKFHVVNQAAWEEKYPEAKCTFVGDIEVGTAAITYHANEKLAAFDDYTKFDGTYALVSHEFAGGTGTATYSGEIDGVGANAFRNMSELTSVDIPEGTAAIDNYAFQNCTGLTNMTLPASVLSIGNYAFSGCTNLATLTITAPPAPNSAPRRTGEVSEGLQRIGVSAFEYCPLTSLALPATLREIDYYAFEYMDKLADVYCDADAADVEWRGSDNGNMFMPGKATQFHVTDAAAWLAKFPNANVTFVDDGGTGISTVQAKQQPSGHIFNLSGQRLDAPRKGINIINGVKVVIK